MATTPHPTTLATRALDAAKVAYVPHVFAYEEKGGTRHSATTLGVDEHAVIKTLIMEDEGGHPLCVLMHGDCSVSTKNLARQLGKKAIQPCRPDVAERHTGYQVGGTSPFGLRKALPIYAEASIFALERIYINGGKRGFLVSFVPSELARVLAPTSVEVANPQSGH